MIEWTIAITLAILGLTISNLRCIHRIEKRLLYLEFEKKERHDLLDK
jgi:hypothetical protein